MARFRIPEIRSEYIWAACFILYIIPVLVPVGSDVGLSQTTIECYDAIEALSEGDIVVMGGSGVFAFDLEPSAAAIAAVRHMARKGLRIVGIPLGVEALQLHKYVMDSAKVMEDQGGDMVYGIDYVQLPYLPGRDAALVRFLEDVHATVPVDAFGTPLSELPLMDDLHSYEDIAVWVCPHWGFPSIVRYVAGERGVTSIQYAHGHSFLIYSVYRAIYPDLVFQTNGFLGGAQYEKLMGISGLGTATIDSYSLGSIAFIVLVVLGNITMLTKRSEEEEEEARMREEEEKV